MTHSGWHRGEVAPIGVVHTFPEGHIIPQAPQLFRSEERFTQPMPGQ